VPIKGADEGVEFDIRPADYPSRKVRDRKRAESKASRKKSVPRDSRNFLAGRNEGEKLP
jgi:hypothetical protein